MRIMLLTASFLLLASMSQAVDILVPGDHTTISAALVAASAGDRIVVGPGTYVENISLKDGVDVISTDGPGGTIIDGGGVNRVVNAITVNVSFDGFTVTGGNATGNGGGMRVQSGSNVTISNCTFVANTSAGEGGGIAIQDSEGLIQFCDFNENTARGGAGVYVDGATGNGVEISQCNIVSNTTAGPVGDGAGLFGDSSTALQISDCVIRDNVAGGLGGGIYMNASTPTIAGCTIYGNAADEGGGISFHNQSAGTMMQCTLHGNGATNAAGNKGGAVSCTNQSAPTIERSILVASTGGGAMNCGVSSMPLVSCCVVFGNVGGDALCGSDNGDSQVADPGFCLVMPEATGLFTIQSDSPCAAANSLCGMRIGAFAVDCGVDPVEAATWGRIKSTYQGN